MTDIEKLAAAIKALTLHTPHDVQRRMEQELANKRRLMPKGGWTENHDRP